MSEFMKTVLKKSSVFFFLSKVDVIQTKRSVSLLHSFIFLFLLSSLYFLLSFFLPSFLSFFNARSDFKAFWRCEIKMHMAVLAQSLRNFT